MFHLRPTGMKHSARRQLPGCPCPLSSACGTTFAPDHPSGPPAHRRDRMKTTAAVLVELGKPLELADLEIPILKPGQALVEVAYSGVCHTQLGEVRGHRGEDRFLPH